MMPRNTGNNGKVILELQGTKKDFVGAWLSRFFLAVIGTITATSVIWFGKLILAGVMYLVNTIPPMQAEFSKMKENQAEMAKDVKDLKEHAATKAELEAAELRVKQEFSEEIKKARVITSTQGK